MADIKGYVSAIQTLGTLDGPGVRYVVFMQGCPLRCGCCHNPETWEIGGGKEYSANEICQKILKYITYFKNNGGITLSGGEPLLQPKFAKHIFKFCKENDIHTCIDTSGCILNDDVKELLELTDYVMLDIKYNSDEMYKKYVGCGINTPLKFLEYLNDKKITTRIRQVIIPTLNDREEDIVNFANILSKYDCIESTELLPFKKICQTKYDDLKINFKFEKIDSADAQQVKKLQKMLNSLLVV